MAPNPNKPYRVCDNCFGKLRKATENDVSSQSSLSTDMADKDTVLDTRSRPQLARFSSMESFKQVETRSSKQKKKLEFNSSRVSPIPNGTSQWGALNISKSLNLVFGSSKKFFSRAISPISPRASPPRSTTPTPTLGGLTSPKIVLDDAKRTNDGFSQEVIKLRAQVENLTRKVQLQDMELERTTKQLKESIGIAGEETAKCKAATEVIKSLTAQLKEMAERLPVGPTGSGDISNGCIDRVQSQLIFQETESNAVLSNESSNRSTVQNRRGFPDPTSRSGARSKESDSRSYSEWIEQDEPGVYITLTSLAGGVKDLKQVRFSRFSEKQAVQWWAENRARVYEQYTVGTVSEELPH